MEQNTDKIENDDSDFEKDYEARIAEINAALERNKNKMAEIEKALTDIDARKIFTLKELREMEKQKQREAEEKLENEKRMIDLITAEALKKAASVRENAVTEGEKVIAEEKALDIELEAILHELDIRKMIIKENESLLEDVLARLAIEESAFQKYKKASLTGSKKDGSYFNIKEAIYKIKSKKDASFSQYRNLKSLIDKQNAKIEKAQNSLRTIYQKLG
ncbi:MAG: hypothetical protein Q4D57_00735 [Clostridia bacterium]|nr:hypothetical protein [Clostridia bacterium]